MVFTVAMILFTAKFFKSSGDLMQMLMLFGCLLFPVVQPIAIYLKAKGQAKTMPKDDAYQRLVQLGDMLVGLIRRSKGRDNKTLAAFAEAISKLISKFEF